MKAVLRLLAAAAVLAPAVASAEPATLICGPFGQGTQPIVIVMNEQTNRAVTIDPNGQEISADTFTVSQHRYVVQFVNNPLMGSYSTYVLDIDRNSAVATLGAGYTSAYTPIAQASCRRSARL